MIVELIIRVLKLYLTLDVNGIGIINLLDMAKQLQYVERFVFL